MKLYYIYHVEGVKIGCTVNPKRRVKDQGYSAFQVLEVHDDIKIASKREIELQIQYGYGRDCTVPYTKSATFGTHEGRSKGGKKTGKINVENGHMSRMGKIGGKINGPIQGKKNAESGQVGKAGKIGGKISGKITGPINGKTSCAIERTCPYCSKTVRGPSYFRGHGQKCKLVPVTT